MVFTMKVTSLFFIYLAYIQGSLAKDIKNTDKKIVAIKEFSYQASLMTYPLSEETSDGLHVCGATILNEEWILTAARCISLLVPDELKVRTGATNTITDGEEHSVKRLIAHPQYDRFKKVRSNDIGLIQLTKPIKFSDVQKPIPLAKSNFKFTPGQSLIVSGYGFENKESKGQTNRLKTVHLPSDSVSGCVQPYSSDSITGKIICAGSSTASICFGDAGDPAIVDGKLVAISSMPAKCDRSGKVAVFTAVYKYLDWISKYVKIH